MLSTTQANRNLHESSSWSPTGRTKPAFLQMIAWLTLALANQVAGTAHPGGCHVPVWQLAPQLDVTPAGQSANVSQDNINTPFSFGRAVFLNTALTQTAGREQSAFSHELLPLNMSPQRDYFHLSGKR